MRAAKQGGPHLRLRKLQCVRGGCASAAGGVDYSGLEKVTLIATDGNSPDSAGNKWQLPLKRRFMEAAIDYAATV